MTLIPKIKHLLRRHRQTRVIRASRKICLVNNLEYKS